MSRGYSTETNCGNRRSQHYRSLMEQRSASRPVGGQCGSMVVEQAVLSSAPHLGMWGPRVPPVGGSLDSRVLAFSIRFIPEQSSKRDGRETCQILAASSETYPHCFGQNSVLWFHLRAKGGKRVELPAKGAWGAWGCAIKSNL